MSSFTDLLAKAIDSRRTPVRTSISAFISADSVHSMMAYLPSFWSTRVCRPMTTVMPDAGSYFLRISSSLRWFSTRSASHLAVSQFISLPLSGPVGSGRIDHAQDHPFALLGQFACLSVIHKELVTLTSGIPALPSLLGQHNARLTVANRPTCRPCDHGI